jgi:hypothetical protein
MMSIGDVAAAPCVALLTEPTLPHPTRARLSGLVWATSLTCARLPAEPEVLRLLPAWLGETPVVLQDGLFDLVLLARHGCDLLEHDVWDVRAMRALLGGGQHQAEYLPRDSAGDVESRCRHVLEAGRTLHTAILRQPSLGRTYAELERPIVSVLAALTLVGLPVDRQALRAAISRTAQQARTLADGHRLRRLMQWNARLEDDGRLRPTYTAWGTPGGEIRIRGAGAFGADLPGVGDLLCLLAPPPGRVLLRVTFPHLHLRWLASLSGAGPLLRALAGEEVSPAPVAEAIFHRSPSPVEARVMWSWLEALATGGGVRHVSRKTGMPPSYVRLVRALLVEALPEIDRFLLTVQRTLLGQGWLQVPGGRRLFPGPRADSRAAASELVVAAAADTVKRWLLWIWPRLPRGWVIGVDRQMVLLEAPARDVAGVVEVCRAAAAAAALQCPLVVAAGPLEGPGGQA